MQLYLKYFFTTSLLFIFCGLDAQVQFEMSVSAKEIGKKDQLQVEYIIQGAEKISGFRLPAFDKWTLISGPSTSTQLYSVNGNQFNIYKYIYVLTPASSGQLSLPGTSVNADGKSISCKSISITVKKQDHIDGVGPAPAYAPPPVDMSVQEDIDDDFKEYELKPGEDPVKKIRSNLFIKVLTSKTKCYVGEPVMVTYKLYTRLRSTSKVAKQPSFNGCSVSEMTTTDIRPETEVLNGKKFRTYVFRQVQLFPLQPGTVTGTIATVDNTVTFISGGSDLRKLYYGIDAGQNYDLSLSTEPFKIEVMPLPGNQSSAVGNFEIFTRLKKDTIAANETNSLIVYIVGRGNFKSVTEPQIEWPGNVYHFDAKETDEIDKLSFPLSGRRIYEIPFEVSAPGKINFTPVLFTYFDAGTGSFKTVKSSPLELAITPAIKRAVQQAAGTGKKLNITYLLYMAGAAFIIGAVVIISRSKKRKTQTASVNEEVVYEATPAAESPKIHYNIKDKLDELIFIQDDQVFYNKACALAKDCIATGNGDNDLLIEVLQDCNTVLYTPIPSTSRKEIFEKLQRALA